MIAIGSDRAGAELKQAVINHLKEKEIEFTEMCSSEEESRDYPAVAAAVCREITERRADFGILVCGTGIGISIAANKCKGIRAAVCTDCYMAKYTRLHNDANVLCLGGRVIGSGLGCEIVDAFLAASFEGGRHKRRVDMITDLEADSRLCADANP